MAIPGMRPLDLDFRRPPASPAGWGLLALGALLLAGVLAGHFLAARATARAEASIAHSERIMPGVSAAPLASAPDRAQRAALAEMQRLSERLRLPWDQLFARLEGIEHDDVALLALAPDARKQQLRITAEARDLAAMLAFHRYLESSGELRDVALIDHEIVDEQPERPVRFNLTATWMVRHARP